MSYTQAYYLDCAQDVEQYNSDCCIPVEFGRVRSVAFIRKAYLQQILSDPENLTFWTDGISNGSIVVIALTAGTFDSGTPTKLKGYGRRLSTRGPRLMQLSFFMPADINNFSFFDDLSFRTDYVPAFRTGSWIHICDSVADIVTKEIVNEDIDGEVLWSVEASIRSRNVPKIYDASNLMSLFSCSTSFIDTLTRLLDGFDYVLDNNIN